MLAAHLEWLCHGIEQSIGQSSSGPGLLTGRQDEGEFVAAHPGNEGVVGGMLQAPRNGAEQLVADDVASVQFTSPPIIGASAETKASDADAVAMGMARRATHLMPHNSRS